MNLHYILFNHEKYLQFRIGIVVLLLVPLLGFCQAPSLGGAANFVLFSSVGAVTNTGNSQITGNVGTNSGACSGFSNINGAIHNADAVSAQCVNDVIITYNQLNNAVPTVVASTILGNGQLLTAGVYAVPSAASVVSNLSFDAQNNPNAVFIIQIQGALSVATNAQVVLVNGAQASNVFWKVEGLVTLGASASMKGTIVANNAAISINTSAVLEGRALTTAGAVTVNGNVAYIPNTLGSPSLTGPVAPNLNSTLAYSLISTNGAVTNTGVTIVAGDVGTNLGSTTGYVPANVSGTIHFIPDSSTGVAAVDLLAAYNYLNGLSYDIELMQPAQFGNDLVLTPHTYLLNAATTLTNNLYLNAEGNPNAVFVIQINGALSTSSNANVQLLNGAQAKNVFWKVDGAVAINTNSIFKGTIIANNGAISLLAGVQLEGRAMTTTGALSTTGVTVTMPVVFTSPPTAVAQVYCVGTTVSSLVATGTAIKWYAAMTGGSALPVATLLATGTYYASQTLNSLESTRTAVTVSVNSEITPTFSPVEAICSGAALSALPLTSTNAITGTWGPALNNTATTTYTFTPASGQCATTTTLAIDVNVTATPIANNQTLCTGSTVASLVAVGMDIKWFTTASGGLNLMDTTPLVAGVYYAAQTVNGCNSPTRKAITVTLSNTLLGSIGAISGVSNVCGLTSTSYSVVALAGASYYVWTFPAGISPVTSAGNQVTVNIDSLFENGLLSVEAYGVCGYTANKANLSLSKVFEIGAISGSATSCGVSTTTYSVPAVAGTTFNWIMPQGITILSGQGTSLVTVVYDNSFHNGTLLSVQATNNCGVSTIRKLVIYNAQKPSSVSGPQHICNATTATYTTSIILGATYNWTPPTNMTIVSGQGTNSIVVNMASGFDTGNLSVTATNACGTSEDYVLLISKTKVSNAISGPKSLCGLVKNTYDTSGTLLESVSGQAVYSVPAVAGAINYTWAVPTGASIVSGQGTNAIVVSFNITTFVNGTITVTSTTPCGTSAPTALAVSRTSNTITGLTYVCSLTSTTYSVPSTIGSNFVWSVPSWMTITSGQNTNSIVVAFPNPAYKEAVTLNYVSSCNSNETITLLVGCNEYSKVASNQCGATLTALDANINADYVAGFQAYRFEVTNGATVSIIEANKYNFSLTQMPGSTYGTTYGVRVAVKMGGTWGAYGVSCNVTTPALTATTIPTTAVMPSFCGSTLTALDTKIGATPVVLATGYRFEITTGGVTTVYDSATYNFRLAQAVTATYGTTYSIRVAAQINGIYGAYEASCNVTTPALAVNVIPTTALLPAVCGTTVTTLTTK